MSAVCRALVVYESMFGNTEQVAVAVTSGLRLGDVEADVVDVSQAPAELPAHLDLLVVGGPTHAFSLSRPRTREDAVRQGADPSRAATGLREWLSSVRHDDDAPPIVAAFDTRVTKVRWLPKAAGPTAVRLAYKHGLRNSIRSAGFLVHDIRGPLEDGELERAVAWGRDLARDVTNRSAAVEVSDRG